MTSDDFVECPNGQCYTVWGMRNDTLTILDQGCWTGETKCIKK